MLRWLLNSAFVAVDFGYSETPVSELGPDRIISRYAELPGAVRALLRPPS